MKKNSGFTLIEVLASITIIGILFTVGIVSYTNFNRKQLVSQGAKNIVNALRQVQSNAINGVKDTTVCGSAVLTSRTLDAWYFDVASKSYTTYGTCSGTTFNSEEISLPADSPITYSITAVGTSPAPPIKFFPLASGTSGNYTICVGGFGNTDYNYKISVNNMGEINEQGFTTCP